MAKKINVKKFLESKVPLSELLDKEDYFEEDDTGIQTSGDLANITVNTRKKPDETITETEEKDDSEEKQDSEDSNKKEEAEDKNNDNTNNSDESENEKNTNEEDDKKKKESKIKESIKGIPLSQFYDVSDQLGTKDSMDALKFVDVSFTLNSALESKIIVESLDGLTTIYIPASFVELQDSDVKMLSTIKTFSSMYFEKQGYIAFVFRS